MKPKAIQALAEEHSELLQAYETESTVSEAVERISKGATYAHRATKSLLLAGVIEIRGQRRPSGKLTGQRWGHLYQQTQTR